MQYPIRCRKEGNLEAQQEVVLDENELAAGKAFFDLGEYAVSPDGTLLAYTTDLVGYRQYVLHVKELRTGKVRAQLAERVTSVAWSRDGGSLFFVQEDPVTKRSDTLSRLDFETGTPEVLYVEKDELYSLGVDLSRSEAFVFAVSQSKTTSEVRYLAANDPKAALKVFLPRRDGHEYYVDHIGPDFFVRTNDLAKTFRLVAAPVADPAPEAWREVLPVRAGVMLEDVECFATHFVTVERENGVPKLTVHDLNGAAPEPVEFSEPSYTVHPVRNEEFETDTFRFSYESLTTPPSVFDYNVKTRSRTLRKQQPVLGGYDPAKYKTERVWAPADDGTRVPISLVYSGTWEGRGARPLVLDGYGSYGIPNDVDFSSSRLSLLDRGVIFAQSHIRGGGDLGKDWHDQGKMMLKKNTFTDFVNCAEFLVREGYTSRDRLVITGGSAGGLLMGAVANLRPDLFKLVVSYVPFVDVMNTMLDESLPLTVGEYLEWGNPNEKDAFEYMLGYSPYENIGKKDYPTMLLRTSLHDSQVGYWEAAKYVARLRELKTNATPVLLKVKIEPGGHGGASGRYDRLEDLAWDYAFILSQLGIKQ
jgi:oligopeptidase B